MLIRTTLVLSVALLIAIGCSSADEDNHDMHDHGAKKPAMDHSSMDHSADEATHTDAAERNLICPVMGGETTDSEIFAEHNGKKVYFCCEGCIDDFKEDPAAYFAKAYPEGK